MIEGPLAVIVNGQTIACQDVVIAIHVPLTGATSLLSATLFQTRIHPYSTYVTTAYVDERSDSRPMWAAVVR